MKSSLNLCLALACTLLASLARADDAPASLAPLLGSIAARLDIAEQVALSKWDSHKAVEDRPREQQVIAAASALANGHGLDETTVGQFFAAQIEANKLVQYARLSTWHLQGQAPDTPRQDLAGQIRPQLDRLQERLLQQLADFSPSRTDPRCPQWLARANHTGDMAPLRQLAMIRATAELCVFKG
ncbi:MULTISPECIES: chorismate mutase [unclassified Pseudomonas]|uniref:chorismate mutase n=1 Tax=unclassified Pseudomonas TaxID=196821 RepID=UPI000837ECBB|nr:MULTISPECIES: chorismate mutase [unclassified Pseudomonas]QIH05719.1 chorismate mutase [Pseudomonas sp. BIOMIG1BAC]UMZ12507.1 chorismate mutase [Pseudomonas sp. MPFS]